MALGIDGPNYDTGGSAGVILAFLLFDGLVEELVRITLNFNNIKFLDESFLNKVHEDVM